MAEHTAGPWFAFDDEIVSEPGDVHVAQVPLCDGTNPTEWQANMRLIAAAPDLLAALIRLVAEPEELESHNAAHRAIARAEGR